jgi:hypothetical protein
MQIELKLSGELSELAGVLAVLNGAPYGFVGVDPAPRVVVPEPLAKEPVVMFTRVPEAEAEAAMAKAEGKRTRKPRVEPSDIRIDTDITGMTQTEAKAAIEVCEAGAKGAVAAMLKAAEMADKREAQLQDQNLGPAIVEPVADPLLSTEVGACPPEANVAGTVVALDPLLAGAAPAPSAPVAPAVSLEVSDPLLAGAAASGASSPPPSAGADPLQDLLDASVPAFPDIDEMLRQAIVFVSKYGQPASIALGKIQRKYAPQVRSIPIERQGEFWGEYQQLVASFKDAKPAAKQNG